VIETNESDLRDAVAILADCDADAERIVSILACDWGWWRTATRVLTDVNCFNAGFGNFNLRDGLANRISDVERRITAAPKGLEWRCTPELAIE
jgi:hypothetical protein